MKAIGCVLPALTLAALTMPPSAAASDLDEFRVKREQVFEFSQKPKVTRDGDRVTITFPAKRCCDATVAIEDAGGRIIRHLASGVLGGKAPAPFQTNSLGQTLIWDGKNDQGNYGDGNERVLSVKLGYHATERVALKTVPDTAAGQ